MLAFYFFKCSFLSLKENPEKYVSTKKKIQIIFMYKLFLSLHIISTCAVRTYLKKTIQKKTFNAQLIFIHKGR